MVRFDPALVYLAHVKVAAFLAMVAEAGDRLLLTDGTLDVVDHCNGRECREGMC